MNTIKILWVDDEIDLLKPHILFLESKNYEVSTCQSGTEAIEKIDEERFDIVFLDENMPGLTGLETLSEIKEKQANIPIVMITKSEEEYIMEEAIGSKIADYLIKPVNPNQILLSIKKNLDHSRLISEKTTSNYQQEFRKIAMDLMNVSTYEDWTEMYQRLIYWELQLENIEDSSMFEILETQKQEANSQFCKFIDKNYPEWFEDGVPEQRKTLEEDSPHPYGEPVAAPSQGGFPFQEAPVFFDSPHETHPERRGPDPPPRRRHEENAYPWGARPILNEL